VIARFSEILENERDAGRAVGAFTCYDVTTAIGVLRAADEVDVATILLVSKASFISRDGPQLVVGLSAVATHAQAPACVQLDHVGDLETIARAIDLGIGAVMADGSRMSLEANALFVKEAARLARSSGAGVEAELGHIEGGEDVATATKAGALTDPEEASDFVARSEADCLAVSIGNVHGEYSEPPNLDWSRLARIRERLDIPLSLHGASGLTEADLRTAVAGGIAKVNLNAELRKRAFRELGARVPELTSGFRRLELEEALANSAAEVALETFRSLDLGANL
jgi:tagatose 1,6-diphosphate aldolase GatY/KbaY